MLFSPPAFTWSTNAWSGLDAQARRSDRPQPKLVRLKGWMLIRQGRAEEAETQLRASIHWVRRQHAKSWELRSSTMLAELVAERGQCDAARELPALIYNWFTGGVGTKDLIAARKLSDTRR